MPVNKKARHLRAKKPIDIPAGKFDSCLIGTLRSESIVRSVKNGGDGIMMKIKGDGEILILYTGMKEVKQVIGGRGRIVRHMARRGNRNHQN